MNMKETIKATAESLGWDVSFDKDEVGENCVTFSNTMPSGAQSIIRGPYTKYEDIPARISEVSEGMRKINPKAAVGNEAGENEAQALAEDLAWAVSATNMLSCRLKAAITQPKYVTVSVHDSGVGIPGGARNSRRNVPVFVWNDYVLYPCVNAFSDGISYWISKRYVGVAKYCFTIRSARDMDVMGLPMADNEARNPTQMARTLFSFEKLLDD